MGSGITGWFIGVMKGKGKTTWKLLLQGLGVGFWV